VAAALASEAMKILPRRIDFKRRRLLLVKRAQPDKIFSASFQGDALADQIDDVGGGQNLGFELIAGSCRHRQRSQSVTRLEFARRGVLAARCVLFPSELRINASLP